MEKIIYKCGCYASGDNVSDKCPIHGDIISNDTLEVNAQMTVVFISTQELEKEIERLHKYERWFDDIYGMMPGILWDSNKISWDKEKAFKNFLEICETADQFKAMKKRMDALLAAVRTLVDAVGEYAGRAGGVHEHGCPEDDTCSCHVMIRFEKAIAAVEALLNG